MAHLLTQQQSRTGNLDDFNNSFVYNEQSMLGKGTFIIRRSTAKKPPRAADVFSIPKPPRPSLGDRSLPGSGIVGGAGAISNEFYTSDSEQSDAAPVPVNLPPPPAPVEMNFVYKECEANALHTRRGLEMAAAQRAALSLDIAEAPDQLGLGKPVKSKTAMLTEKRLSAESMPDNTSSSEEFDEARLNGNGSYDLYAYNGNGRCSKGLEILRLISDIFQICGFPTPLLLTQIWLPLSKRTRSPTSATGVLRSSRSSTTSAPCCVEIFPLSANRRAVMELLQQLGLLLHRDLLQQLPQLPSYMPNGCWSFAPVSTSRKAPRKCCCPRCQALGRCLHRLPAPIRICSTMMLRFRHRRWSLASSWNCRPMPRRRTAGPPWWRCMPPPRERLFIAATAIHVAVATTWLL